MRATTANFWFWETKKKESNFLRFGSILKKKNEGEFYASNESRFFFCNAFVFAVEA